MKKIEAIIKPFKLEEVNTREDQRSVSGYQKSGDRVTLPYTELELLGNNFATKTVNPIHLLYFSMLVIHS